MPSLVLPVTPSLSCAMSVVVSCFVVLSSWVLLAQPVVVSGASAGVGKPSFQTLRTCGACVAVSGYGWCPIARKCSPGYPSKGPSACRGDETDFARDAAPEADGRLKEKLQDDERGFHLAILFYNLPVRS